MVSDSSFLHTTSNLETSGDLYILKNSPPQQGPGWHLRSQAHQQGIVGAHICRGLPHGAPSLSLSPLPWPPMKGRCFCPISQRSSVRLWGTRICHPASEHKQRLSPSSTSGLCSNYCTRLPGVRMRPSLGISYGKLVWESLQGLAAGTVSSE